MNKDTAKALIQENSQQITRMIGEFEAQLAQLVSEVLEYGTEEHKEALRKLLQELLSKLNP